MAMRRAWLPTALMFCVHAGSVLVGAIMVNNGNPFALRYRDQLVARAHLQDPSSLALASGHRLEAAAWDFSRNLLLGAVPSTVGGLGIGIPYLIAIHRGWVGGIVSIDSSHVSRLIDPAEREYYLLTLILQLIPYSLAGGAGVRLGLAYLRRPKSGEPTWIGLPQEALRDVLWIYTLVVPLFAIASLWEFLAR
ncbi:MAG TPA: stage II sporulation protein M [Anaerolineales bacterium]|nr:stage II sporulation protein M [Anaerolineales bacterium]